jgi:hypothetical protein
MLMGTPLPASPPITPFAEYTIVQFANKKWDKKTFCGQSGY